MTIINLFAAYGIIRFLSILAVIGFLLLALICSMEYAEDNPRTRNISWFVFKNSFYCAISLILFNFVCYHYIWKAEEYFEYSGEYDGSVICEDYWAKRQFSGFNCIKNEVKNYYGIEKSVNICYGDPERTGPSWRKDSMEFCYRFLNGEFEKKHIQERK
jgi:hypothetical protein